MQEGKKTRDIAEVALLYVGVPAVTLYPLGFVALGIQLWRDPFFPYTDFTTIWEAVALISQTVVIKTGIKLIYLSLVATALGVGIASLTSAFLQRRHKTEEYKQERPGRRLWRLYLLILLPLAALLVWTSVPIDDWDDAIYLAAFILFSVGGGVLMGYIRARRPDDWLFPGLAVAYAGAICAALALAAMMTPDLALIEIDAEEGAPSDCSEATGKTFVKLEEGLMYWHVYNRNGLFAIPHEDLHLVKYKHCPEYMNRN